MKIMYSDELAITIFKVIIKIHVKYKDVTFSKIWCKIVGIVSCLKCLYKTEKAQCYVIKIDDIIHEL